VESTGELAWFRGEVLRSLVSPRSFARSLAREHFGLAGVLVVLVSGIALSLTIDVLVLALKGISPGDFVSRLIFEALLLGVRLDVSVAVVAFVLYLGLRATRRDLSLDQTFNAVAFALSPLVLAPIAAVPALVDDALLIVGGVLLAFIVGRAFAGLVLNLRAILPLPLAALALVLALASGYVVVGDQVSRVRMTAYAIVPQLAPPLSATPAQGESYDLEGITLMVPEEWIFSRRGIPGEVAHFETATATLNVVRSRPEALATMDAFADTIARGERLGFSARRDDRSVERINGLVAVDDRAEGTYEARHIALRQFTIVQRTSGMALQFRFFDPPDVEAAFAQAAAIAASWRISGPS
jgi:hypothetical protein